MSQTHRLKSRYADYLMYVVFAGLRAYAISGRNKWVLTIVLLLGLVNPTAYIVSCIQPVLREKRAQQALHRSCIANSTGCTWTARS